MRNDEPQIFFSKTAYVHDCTRTILDRVAMDIGGWASGQENVCITTEALTEYLENVDYFNEIIGFLEKVKVELGDFDGDIVFC